MVPIALRAPLSLVAALMLVRLADEWFTFFPAGALAPIRADLGLSYAQAGAILTALPAGGIIGDGFTLAADYVNRRLLSALGALVVGLALFAFALTHAFIVLLVAAFLWGAASDAFVHGCEVALVDLARDDLPPALARVNAYGAAGDLLGPLTLAAAEALGLGWRAPFALGGALMLLYAAWLLTQRFPPPTPAGEERSPLASVLAVLRDRRVIVLAVVAELFGLLDEPLLGFVIAYLEQARGVAPAGATAVTAVIVAAGLAGYLAVSAVSRRMSVRRLLIGGAAALTVSVAAIVAVPVAGVVAVAGAVFGFTGAIFYSVLQATYLSLRPGQAGATTAVVSTIGMAGIGFPTLVGAVADRAGLQAGLWLYAAVPLAALALLLLLFPKSTASSRNDGGRAG